MNNFTNLKTVNKVEKIVFRLPSVSLVDKAKVQLGGQGPVFRTSEIADKSKVRLGGQSPIFRK